MLSGVILFWGRVLSVNDIEYMRHALSLARKGAGRVSPNPMVGAVLVRDGKIIAEGYHKCCGGLHAEREAFAACRESPAGATLYVTLEPCCHHGRQPPCTDAILGNGIQRVVIGSRDPNPLVAGKGIRILRQNGIEVIEDVAREECDALNQVFFHYIRTKTPYVIMKYAMTLDGKIATRTGASQWITGEAARQRVHEDRNRYAAVLVGVGTVIADDPSLTCRLPNGRNPVRIVCDSSLRTPLTATLVQTAAQTRTILATCNTDAAAHAPYVQAGCEVLVVPKKDSKVDLCNLMQKLGAMELDSIVLEGGGALNWSALESGIVCHVQAYVAPKLFGGADANGAVMGLGVALPSDAWKLDAMQITRLGDDLLLECEVVQDVHGDC